MEHKESTKEEKKSTIAINLDRGAEGGGMVDWFTTLSLAKDRPGDISLRLAGGGTLPGLN